MANAPAPTLFSTGTPEPQPRSALPWIIAVTTVVIVLAAVLLLNHRKPAPAANTPLPLDPYAAQVIFSDLVMSESTSLSGGKSTYIDGHVQNAGTKTLTAATVQVLFANDESLPPQVETTPLNLIRTRQPYVDTQSVTAAPLAPGDEREFRLTFEGIGTNWNQQLPQIHLTSAITR